jgi:hypothetical protein
MKVLDLYKVALIVCMEKQGHAGNAATGIIIIIA